MPFTQISARASFTRGRTATSEVYCWGYSGSGQSGTGTSADFSSWSSRAPATGNLVFAQISAGIYHPCGPTTSAATYRWGFNGSGQIGDGVQTDPQKASVFSPPTPVTEGPAFTQITTGLYHSCGLTTSGTAYCWGYNDSGQLGDGTDRTRLVPTRIRIRDREGEIPVAADQATVSNPSRRIRLMES